MCSCKCLADCCAKSKEVIEKLKNREYTKSELILIGAVVFLGGLVLGMLLSPKGDRIIGSNNGSFNGEVDFEEE